MPTKKTTKSDSKISKSPEKKVASKSENKKDSTKKVVVKRRKSDLKPTKASAVAIASQASRAKKQALIEKVASSEVPYKKSETSSNTKIPLWVWTFFWCSLLLFCVSFYKAIIYPQLGGEQISEESVEFLKEWNEDNSFENNYVEEDYQYVDDSENFVDEYDNEEIHSIDNSWVNVPETATETIEEFFNRLSDRNFDWAFDLMIPVLRSSSEIRNHFSSFRMEPFLDWIQGWRLTPVNFVYVNSPTYWKDVYNFDLSYVMNSDQSIYDETWEFTVTLAWNEPKISSIRCVTSKCSYHPIFWPENFGLMR